MKRILELLGILALFMIASFDSWGCGVESVEGLWHGTVSFSRAPDAQMVVAEWHIVMDRNGDSGPGSLEPCASPGSCSWAILAGTPRPKTMAQVMEAQRPVVESELSPAAGGSCRWTWRVLTSELYEISGILSEDGSDLRACIGFFPEHPEFGAIDCHISRH